MVSERYEYGDWAEHPRYGAGRFVQYDTTDWADAAFTGSRWDFNYSVDDQPRTDWELRGVRVSGLQLLRVTS